MKKSLKHKPTFSIYITETDIKDCNYGDICHFHMVLDETFWKHISQKYKFKEWFINRDIFHGLIHSEGFGSATAWLYNLIGFKK